MPASSRKAILHLDLISTTTSKNGKHLMDRHSRFSKLIKKADECDGEPDNERFENFSKLVFKFRSKLGKVVLNQNKADFGQRMKSLHIQESYIPKHRSILVTVDDT